MSIRILSVSTSFALLLTTMFVQSSLAKDWKYPKLSPGMSGQTRDGNTLLTSSSVQEVSDGFQTVLKWYAEQANVPDLADNYQEYLKRDKSEPDISTGSKDIVHVSKKAESRGTLLYSFTPQLQHVTMFIPDEEGDVVVVTISGTPDQTTVQVLHRHQPG